MCNLKKAQADKINKIVSYQPSTEGAGEWDGFVPSKSPYTEGDGTYQLEYLTCSCRFKVVVIGDDVFKCEE